jgi:hypothetical protein
MGGYRLLRQEEMDLIAAMLGKHPKQSEIVTSLRGHLVEGMEDGGMGNLRFKTPEDSRLHVEKKIAEAEFVDDDGVLVSVTLTVGDDGELTELDVWKVDFKPLKRYPRPNELFIKSTTYR